MSFFLNSRGDLRTVWKFAAFISIWMPAWIAVSVALRLVFNGINGSEDELHRLALEVVINLIPAIIATLFAARIIEDIPVQALGLGFHKKWNQNLVAGFSIGGFLLVLVVAGARSLGEFQLDWAPYTNPLRLVLTLGILIVAAAFEELIFRGYPMQVLMKGMGPWPAMLIMSSLFGLLHARNPNSSVLGVFNTIVAGMMLSLAYFKTRSLWFPYGLHLAWNVGTGMLVGFPLSGTGFASIWVAHVNGPSWLLGADYGPEGGLLGTLVFLAGAAVVWKLPAKEMKYDDRLYKNSSPG
jgi:membrane protease YdiL (CAAX protease family)